MSKRSGHWYQGMPPEIGLKISTAGKRCPYLYQQFPLSRLWDCNILNFDCPRTFQYSGEQASDFHSCAEYLTYDCCNKKNRYVAPIKMRKYPGKSNKWDRQMDIEEPFKREPFLFAPEITENHVQTKGKNTYQYNGGPSGGKIHAQKYLNCCCPVKPSGLIH